PRSTKKSNSGNRTASPRSHTGTPLRAISARRRPIAPAPAPNRGSRSASSVTAKASSSAAPTSIDDGLAKRSLLRPKDDELEDRRSEGLHGRPEGARVKQPSEEHSREAASTARYGHSKVAVEACSLPRKRVLLRADNESA